jgi:hypothetical protein
MINRQKKYYLKNRIKILELSRIFYKKNCNKILKLKKISYNKNRSKILKYKKLHYKKNRDSILMKKKLFCNKHKVRLNKQHSQWNKNNKKQINVYLRRKYKTNINYRISKNLRIRIHNALKGINKLAHTPELIGCSIDQLKQHLQSQFTVNGM